MITAVDTSVLVAITKAEPDAHEWINLLAGARADGNLVACDIVAAELFARIAAIDRGYLRRYFPRLKVLQPR